MARRDLIVQVVLHVVVFVLIVLVVLVVLFTRVCQARSVRVERMMRWLATRDASRTLASDRGHRARASRGRLSRRGLFMLPEQFKVQDIADIVFIIVELKRRAGRTAGQL